MKTLELTEKEFDELKVIVHDRNYDIEIERYDYNEKELEVFKSLYERVYC